MFKRVFVNTFINRVILYDDKVIILYNSNDRETKRLNKKQLKEVENAKNLEEIKENSSERKKFKRVSLGGGKGIRTLVRLLSNGFQDRLVMTTSITLLIEKSTHKCALLMAQKEGFEPSRAFYTPTPLAWEPLRPLGYFCT